MSTAVPTSVDNAVYIPESTAVDSQGSTAVGTGVIQSPKPARKKSKEPTPARAGEPPPSATLAKEKVSKERPALEFEYLDATHSSSEAKVYSVMYRECLYRKVTEYRFGLKELRAKTGLSDKTLRVAIHNLEAKLSIGTVEGSMGVYGRKFRIFHPREIINFRRERGMTIDPVTKKIVGDEHCPVVNPIVSTIDTAVATAVKTTALDPPPSLLNKNILNHDEDGHASSSTSDFASCTFDHRTHTIALYERFTGNTWKALDDPDYETIKDILLEAVEAGILSSVLRCGTKVNSFHYCVGGILELAEFMPPGYLAYLRMKASKKAP